MLLTHLSVIGILRNYDGDGKGNVKKTEGLVRKTTTLHEHHGCLHISLLRREMSTFYQCLVENGNCKAINSTISV